MTEELIKLMLSVTGGDAISDLRDQLGYTNVAVEQLKEAFQRGDVTTDEFLRTAKKLTDQQKMLTEAVAEADAVMARQEAAAKAEADAIAELAAEQQRLADMQEDAARAAIDLADAQDLLGTAAYDVVEAQTAMSGSTVYVVGTADDAEQAYRDELIALDDLKDGASLSAAEMARLGAAKTGLTNVTGALKSSIKSLENELEQLKKDAQSGAISLDEFRAKASLAQQALGQQKAMLGALGDQSAFSGHKLLQFGQILDDMQYVGEMGLRPIINNVMQMNANLGIAMIVGQSFVSLFGDRIVEAIASYAGETAKAQTETERLAKQIEELEKKPHKLAVDYKDLEEAQAKLDKLKADEAAYKAAKESDPEKELAKQAASTVTKYAGGADQLTAIVDAMEKQGGFKHGPAELYARLDKLKYQLENPEFDARTGVAKYDPETTKKNIAEVEAEIERARKQYAKDQVTAFVSGDPGAIAAMQGRVARNPGAFNRQGLDGLTAGEAIRNLPASTQEMARRLQVDEEIAATDEKDKENKGEFRQARGERLRREAKAQADEDRHAVEEQNMAENRRREIAAKEKRDKEIQQRQQEKRRAEAKREEAQLERDRLDPMKLVKSELQKSARSGLQRMGYGEGLAAIAAPRLAELVSQGMDVQSATMQSVMEANRQIQLANEALQKNQQMLILIQQQQRRMRTMMPTTQPVPFAN